MKLTKRTLRQIVVEEWVRFGDRALSEAKRLPLAMAWANEAAGSFNLVMTADRAMFDEAVGRLAPKLRHYGRVSVDAKSMTLAMTDWSAPPEDIELVVNEAEQVLSDVLGKGYDTFYGRRGLPPDADFGVAVTGSKKPARSR